MNKILYEASYIGNSKSFYSSVVSVIESIGILIVIIVIIYTLKKERDVEEEYRGNKDKEYFLYVFKYIFLSIFALIWGLGTLLELGGSILGYDEVILGYKRGKYREVEGFVEDYTDAKTHTFTVGGVEFTVSAYISTWGYTYWKSDQNVITGDGQHLRIRYIPRSSGSNTIVYIEEIGPPLTRPDDTEEAQQEEEIEEPVQQEKEPEESAVSTDQVGIQERTEEETKLIQNILSQDLDRIEIQGRTEEETELIRKILSQDKEEFQSFLMADGVFPYKEAIWVSAYDFTGDGRDEILVSKYYVDMSAELTYNYVYDQTGRRVLEFVGGGDTRIIDGWDGDGTFLLYDKNYYFYAPRYNTNTYTEIRCEDDVLSEKVILVELDRRPPRDYGKEEYYIFTDFTKEEEEKLWEGGLGVNELTETKEYVREDKRADEYRELFQEGETTGFSKIAIIRYSESDESQEYTE